MADISYQAPQTSAGEILAYKGDPALAGGFDSHGQSTGIQNLFTPVQDMLKQLQGQAFQRRMVEYNQAIKDRDASLEMLKDPRLNVDMDVAEEDRQKLEEDRQKIIDLWKQNPSMDNTNAYADFQRSVQQFQQKAASSKSRNLEKKKQLQMIAQEQNPAVRNAMLQHLDAEMKKGLDHQIMPYFKNPSFEPFPDVPMAQVGEPVYASDETGTYHQTKTMRTPVSAFADYVAPDKLMANNGMRLQQVQMLHDNFAQSPFAQDDNNLTAMNTKLAQINADNGLTQGSPYFLQPIAKKGEDGKWQVNDSPAEFAKSFYAYSRYNEKKDNSLAPEYQKSLKLKAETERTEQQIVKEKELANKYRVEAEEAKRKGDANAEKAALEKAAVSAPASDAYNMFHDVSKYKTYSTPEEKQKAFQPNIMASLKKAGIGDDWQITPLPLTTNYRNALATTQPRTTKGGAQAANGVDMVRPSRIIAVHAPGAPLSEYKIVGLDKTGQFMKAIDINEAAGELIKANAGYKLNAQTQTQIDAARGVMQQLIANNGTQPQQQQKQGQQQSRYKTVPLTTELRDNGGAIEANVNGKWVKVKGKTKNGIVIE